MTSAKRFTKFIRAIIKAKLFRIFFAAILLNFLFGTAFYFVERDVQQDMTLIDAIWWSMVTMTTVGYGDFYAQTNIGRFLISYPCMLIGIGIIGYLIGIFAEIMLENVSRKGKGLMSINSKNHIIICNCPSIDKILNLAEELRGNKGFKESDIVVITDKLDYLPEEFKVNNITFIKGDPIREDILHRANIGAAACIFILAKDPQSTTSDEKTFLTATIISMIKKERAASYKVFAEVISKNNEKMIKRTGIDEAILIENVADCLMAQEYLSPGVNKIIHQLLSYKYGSEIYTYDIDVAELNVVNIQKAALDKEVSFQVLGIMRNERAILNPGKNLTTRKGDKLIIMAREYIESSLVKSLFQR